MHTFICSFCVAIEDYIHNLLISLRLKKLCYILQVNEYPPGVGLSPHIDTHSAFEGLILSLSLAGPCIMEFRRYIDGDWHYKASLGSDVEDNKTDSNFVRKAIHLPPRSMLLLSGEARYAWHHYIPHHKVCLLIGDY